MKDKNRCLSAAPGLGWRCELRKGHIDESRLEGYPFPKHKAGFLKWEPEEGSIWTGPQPTGVLAAVPNENFFFRYGTPPSVDPTIAPPAADEGPSPQALAVDELSRWWLDTAKREIGQTVAKAIEYGSTDLIDIGRTLGRVAGRDLDDQEAAEWGVFFYLEGKLSRWRSAIQRGERPSADTLLDFGVYARMAQRIRETGGWPGTMPPTPFGLTLPTTETSTDQTHREFQ